MKSTKRIGWVVSILVAIICSGVAIAQPNIQLGSATGAPGETVTIPVTFTNNNSGVVGFQFDMQFNSTQLAVGTLTDGTVLSPHLRHSSTPSAGTLRVLIRPDVSPTLPNINDGVLVNIPFTISPGATPSTYDLTLAGVVFSDKSANAVSAGTLTKGQITVGTPHISVSPMALDFTGVKVGSCSPPQSVTVSNLGSATANLGITKIEITGVNAGEFSQSNDCTTVTPGNHCTVSVTLTPGSSGLKTGQLAITSNDPDHGVVNVDLNGTGGVPHILARRVILSEDFSAGIPSTWTSVDAWSTGCGKTAITDPFVAPWAIVDPLCGAVSDELLYTPIFDASACTELALLFSNRFSHGTGTTGTVSVTDSYGKTWTDVETLTSDEGPTWKETDISTAAGAEGAQIEFAYSTSGGFWAIDNVWVLCTPPALSFKALQGSTSEPRLVMVKNTGTADLSIASIDRTGAGASQFQVLADECTGKALGPSETCLLQVVFTPGSTGEKTANLSIASDDSDHSTLDVPLTGKGVILLARPEQGTLGSQITIHGSGFGDKKGKALVGGAALKVLSWSSNSIEGLVSKVLTLGPGTVVVQTKQKGASPITQDDAFSVETPQIWTIVPDHGGVNTPVVITGKYFGTKKGKVTIGGKSCKVTTWTMDATTGASTVQFLVPKGLSHATTYPINVINKVGEGADSFTID